jgi:hypothetical protein
MGHRAEMHIADTGAVRNAMVSEAEIRHWPE